MLACQAVVFEAGRNLASKSAFVSLRRDSLRLSCLKAKAGGKGIRTPGLLIANETLYQLSYTPDTGKRRLARRGDFSSSETVRIFLVERVTDGGV